MKLWNWIVSKWTEKARLRERLAQAREASSARANVLRSDRDSARGEAARLKRELAAATKLAEDLKKLAAPRYVKVPERGLPEAELEAELAVDDENAQWRAVHQLLDRAISDAVDAVKTAAGEDRTKAAGAIEHLQAFQQTLLTYQERGRKAERQEEEA